MAEHADTAPSEPGSEEAPVSTFDLDSISLAQALQDVDVANARVIDLTKRLTTLNAELRRTTTDLQKARMRNKSMAAELETVRRSAAYRSASAAQRVVRGARSKLGK